MFESQRPHCAIAALTAFSSNPAGARTERRPASLNFQLMTLVPFLSAGHRALRSWKSGHVDAFAHGPLVAADGASPPNGSENASASTLRMPGPEKDGVIWACVLTGAGSATTGAAFTGARPDEALGAA